MSHRNITKVKNNILLLLFFSFLVSANAQLINDLSDFFRNKKGEVKISKSKQAKLKVVLGSSFNCILECCLNNHECSITKTSQEINSKIEQIEKDYIDRYQRIQILKWRNSDTLSKMKLNLDTINYFKNFAFIKLDVKNAQEIKFKKSKISTYLNPKLFENSDLKRYISVLNDLARDQDLLLSYNEKLDKWEELLKPIEKERVARTQEEWKQFVKGQMLVRWDIEKERLEKERLKEEEEEKRREEEEEQQREQEIQKFYKWEENLRFTINYKQKIIEGIYRCVRCQEESVACHDDDFPNLDFSNYAYPDHMKKLWERHKNNESTVQTDIFGIPDDCFLIKFGKILDNKNPDCRYCGRTLKYYEKSKTVNKTFKN